MNKIDPDLFNSMLRNKVILPRISDQDASADTAKPLSPFLFKEYMSSISNLYKNMSGDRSLAVKL
jgi:hypothetical protein